MNEHDHTPCLQPARWPQPGELWSLWDLMKLINMGRASLVADDMANNRKLFFSNESLSKGEHDAETREAISTTLKSMADLCRDLDEPVMADHLLEHSDDTYLPTEAFEFDVLCRGFFSTVRRKTAVFLDRTEREFLDVSGNGYGRDVHSVLGGTLREVVSAARCIAFGLSTAAVFHLMRAMEISTRQMALHLGASFADTADWGTVIGEINKKIEAMPKGPERTRWSEASKNFWHVKESTRNEVMHVRKESYSIDQARDNWAATKVFMTQLAELLRPAAPAPVKAPIPRPKPPNS